MQLTFEGRTVVVTGAAHGFGRAISKAFAECNANVWACDILEEELAETEAQCRGVGGRCQTKLVDVTDRAAIQAFIGEVESAHGPIDILINNAERWGQPEDITHGVLFFASDYASWLSGQVLFIDGGK